LFMIEFKTPDGKIDPYQKAVHCAHGRQGIMTWVFRDGNTAFEFASAIVDGMGSYDFKEYISPYSLRPDMYSIFALEAKQSDCKHKGSPCGKCGWIKGTKLTTL